MAMNPRSRRFTRCLIKMKKLSIVVGINHVNTLGLIRSLGLAGYRVIVFLEPCDLRYCTLRFSRYVGKLHHLTALDELVDLLKTRYCLNDCKTPILCSSDRSMALLDAHYAELQANFVLFNIKRTEGLIPYYMDKVNTFPLAKKCGLKTIATWHVKSGESIPADIPFPCFVKGNSSLTSSKEIIRICQDRNELKEALRSGCDYLVQEYIKKDCELNLNGFAYNGGKDVYLPGIIFKIRESLERQGEYMRLDPLVNYPTMNIEGIRNFIAELGYEGLFSIEQLKCGDEYYFLEINLRNDGLNWIYTAAGANFPKLWALYAERGLTEADTKGINVKMPFFVMLIVDIWNVIEKRISFLQWLHDFCMCDSYFHLSLRDPGPALYLTWIFIRQGFKKVIRKWRI